MQSPCRSTRASRRSSTWIWPRDGCDGRREHVSATDRTVRAARSRCSPAPRARRKRPSPLQRPPPRPSCAAASSPPIQDSRCDAHRSTSWRWRVASSRTTTTDASGRYEFTDLPGARYTVMASKGGYVQMSYGQTRSLEPGKPVEILDGRIVEDIDFALAPGRGDHGPRRRRARRSGGGGGGGDPPSPEHRWSASTGARWERRHERRSRRIPAFRHFARPVLPVGRREQSGCRPAAGHRRAADLRDDVLSQRHRPRRGAASVDRHRRDDERCDRRSGARAQGSDHRNRRRLAGPSDGRSGPPATSWPQFHRLRRVRQGADSPGRLLHDRPCDSREPTSSR